MAKIKYLVIHCTGTPEGREVSADEIRRWHTAPPPSGRGWKQVGYTDMVHLNGRIERLVKNEDANVDTWEITNGAVGFNSVSRHIVYVGGIDARSKSAKDTRTEAQKISLRKYVEDFHKRFPGVRIIGHNQLNKNKACPSFDVPKWLSEIGLK